jgi:hypothetical protein
MATFQRLSRIPSNCSKRMNHYSVTGDLVLFTENARHRWQLTDMLPQKKCIQEVVIQKNYYDAQLLHRNVSVSAMNLTK